jgi:peptide/nickel transport system substrate-binding protein
MTTRRTVLKGAAGAGFLAATPYLSTARAQTTRANTFRVVTHTDLAGFDPITTTANIVAYHGGLIYDTLFAQDAEFNPRPQMVQDFAVSSDRLTYTFALRPGLRFHDGQPVTARDCVASVKRWGARDGAGQHMFRRVTEIAARDERTFTIRLSEPYPLLIDWLAKSSPNVCFIMRESDASTDPARPITETVGSGPYMYNRGDSRQGSQYVYDRNPNYVPRSEPSSGTAGGKIANMARVVMVNIADGQTAVSALTAGEVDMVETVAPELQDQLRGNRQVNLEVLDRTGSFGVLRMNWLHPPFDNLKARQAMLHLIDQRAVMQTTFGDADSFRTCASLFACGTTMENDANTAWFREGQNIAKAAALFKEAGYDGRRLVVLQQTTSPVMNNTALLVAQWLRQAGVAVDLVPLDWPGIVARRGNRNAPTDGGWNIFFTFSPGIAYDNPLTFAGHAANGTAGWFGWPENARHEQLRDAWAAAPDLDARKAVAREMQDNAWNYIPHVYLGQWLTRSAIRSDVKGLIRFPNLVPFWNVSRG